jgi:hypothetical protein
MSGLSGGPEIAGCGPQTATEISGYRPPSIVLTWNGVVSIPY